MPTILQLRRGTDSQNNDFIGAAGELTFDTTNSTIRAHDGSTQGGHRLATFSELSGAGFDSADVLGIVDSAYIQSRQNDIFRDSGFVTGIIDEVYIQARDRIRDSGFVTTIIDSAYVQAFETSQSRLKWEISGATDQYRTATEYIDSDGETYTIRTAQFSSNLLRLELAQFSPSMSASGQSLNWDQPATQFSVTVNNPADFLSRYINAVSAIAETGGDVHETISDFTTSGPSVTPDGGVDWNQTFTTNATAFIRSTSTTISGGSASATITFAEDDSSDFATTSSFTTNWTTPNVSISMSNLSGNVFLNPYLSTSYSVSVSGFSNSANYSTTVTPTGGTISNATGSGTFTFSTELHQDNTGGRTLAVSTDMTRPAEVTGTEYTVTDTASDTSLSSSWTFPSLSIFTASAGTSPTNSDIVDGTGFTGDVTTYGNQSRTIDQFITNSQNVPQSFWFGVRTSASQPSTFQTGASAALLSDVTPTEVTVNLNNTYTDEDYDFYGITLQPGQTYVSIS